MKNKNEFKFYYLNSSYYDYLFNSHNLKEYQMLSKPKRPYIAVAGIKVNGIDYVIPLKTHNHKNLKEGMDYTIPIYNSNNNVINLLKINKMIPVVMGDLFIKEMTINDLSEDHNKHKLLETITYLNSSDGIYKKVCDLANDIHQKIVELGDERIHSEKFDIRNSVDFKQAEKAMFDYCWKNNIEFMLPVYLWEYLSHYSELNDYLEKENIPKENIFTIYESECITQVLIKHNDNTIQFIEEIWDSEENDSKEIFLYTPYINNEKSWDLNNLKNNHKNQKDFIDELLDTIIKEDEDDILMFELEKFLNFNLNKNTLDLSNEKPDDLYDAIKIEFKNLIENNTLIETTSILDVICDELNKNEKFVNLDDSKKLDILQKIFNEIEHDFHCCRLELSDYIFSNIQKKYSTSEITKMILNNDETKKGYNFFDIVPKFEDEDCESKYDQVYEIDCSYYEEPFDGSQLFDIFTKKELEEMNFSTELFDTRTYIKNKLNIVDDNNNHYHSMLDSKRFIYGLRTNEEFNVNSSYFSKDSEYSIYKKLNNCLSNIEELKDSQKYSR